MLTASNNLYLWKMVDEYFFPGEDGDSRRKSNLRMAHWGPLLAAGRTNQISDRTESSETDWLITSETFNSNYTALQHPKDTG